jgi:hypothetical protein
MILAGIQIRAMLDSSLGHAGMTGRAQSLLASGIRVRMDFRQKCKLLFGTYEGCRKNS